MTDALAADWFGVLANAVIPLYEEADGVNGVEVMPEEPEAEAAAGIDTECDLNVDERFLSSPRRALPLTLLRSYSAVKKDGVA